MFVVAACVPPRRLGQTLTSSKTKSSEELELDRIRQLKKELQHKRQLAQESYKKAMTRAVPAPVHSAVQPTVPQEFNFHGDRRPKAATQPAEKAEGKSVADFVRSLRSRTVSSPVSEGGGGLFVCRRLTRFRLLLLLSSSLFICFFCRFVRLQLSLWTSSNLS